MTALRSAARTAQVDLTLALEGCHTGVFADVIRGGELRDTLAAVRAQAGAASGAAQPALQALVPVLDNAIAVQAQKDGFNARVHTWWARRYELERQYLAAPENMDLLNACQAHYETLQVIWNNFATPVIPCVTALWTNAATAGIVFDLPQRIAPLSGTFDQDGEQAIQAGLDDLDTILNRILQETDSRLR